MKKSLLLIIALLFTSLQVVLAQSEAIRGKVLDDKGEPVIGATIRIKNTAKGTVTDQNGNFKINAEDDATLSISAIGMKPTENLLRMAW
ncbi:MAG: carboxypeptidase-like regulatory domain-containing protein [Bacteroidetes bacterium]|nr:carboxypeptidase-like regulatory domain-containing protein [Bacteroidota bacterium]